jgi:hypothetical protein
MRARRGLRPQGRLPGLQATYPAANPVAAVFWPSAGLSAGAAERRLSNLALDKLGWAGLGGGLHGTALDFPGLRVTRPSCWPRCERRCRSC